jgi:hypothetical protein
MRTSDKQDEKSGVAAVDIGMLVDVTIGRWDRLTENPSQVPL